jgi:cytochrome o ubiquinol oxidase subunit 2
MLTYKAFSNTLLLPMVATLRRCNFVVMSPSGDIATQQRDLILTATVLMLLVIVPVMFLISLFAWRYRESNSAARYEPDWHHSTHLELVIWSAPLVIIIALSAVTWISTHQLDPFGPLERIDPTTPINAKTAMQHAAGRSTPIFVQTAGQRSIGRPTTYRR